MLQTATRGMQSGGPGRLRFPYQFGLARSPEHLHWGRDCVVNEFGCINRVFNLSYRQTRLAPVVHFAFSIPLGVDTNSSHEHCHTWSSATSRPGRLEKTHCSLTDTLCGSAFLHVCFVSVLVCLRPCPEFMVEERKEMVSFWLLLLRVSVGP